MPCDWVYHLCHVTGHVTVVLHLCHVTVCLPLSHVTGYVTVGFTSYVM